MRFKSLDEALTAIWTWPQGRFLKTFLPELPRDEERCRFWVDQMRAALADIVTEEYTRGMAELRQQSREAWNAAGENGTEPNTKTINERN